jgi:hypothetical protein
MRIHDQLQLLVAILAQWQCPVATTKSLDLVRWAICVVLYRRTAAAINMASKVGPFFVVVLFAATLAAARAIPSN